MLLVQYTTCLCLDIAAKEILSLSQYLEWEDEWEDEEYTPGWGKVQREALELFGAVGELLLFWVNKRPS